MSTKSDFAWGLVVGLLLGVAAAIFAYMYPEPTWQYGRSTAYKWTETIRGYNNSLTTTECFVWQQREQSWRACEDFDRTVRDRFPVEWSDPSAGVTAGLPPK